MAITLRAVTGSALTHNQVDLNFSSYFYTASLSGQVLSLIYPSSSFSAIPSMSITLPSASKWSDISGGGITRTSTVEVTGSLNNSGSTSIVGNLTNGNSALVALNLSHAEGESTTASGSFSHAEGNGSIASGSHSHAEGSFTTTAGNFSHAEGKQTTTVGAHSHAEGNGTVAFGTGSHVEGNGTIASGSYSHAEGLSTISSGSYSHAEGSTTQAIGEGSHAEGYTTEASGFYSHAEGGFTKAIGNQSHAEGVYTVALGDFQHVQGQYNISSSAQSAFIIGNGISDGSRSNLVFASASQFQVTGSAQITGSLQVTGSADISGSARITNGLIVTGSLQVKGTTLLLDDSPLRLAPANYSAGTSGNIIFIGTPSGQTYTTINSRNNGGGINGNLILQNDGNGNVGINTNTPTAKLDINGDVRITNSLVITGSVRGQVLTVPVASNTASIDLTSGSFWSITLNSGVTTHISASNIQPGQTTNLRVIQNSTPTGVVSFSSAFKQPSGSAYIATTSASAVDVLSFISFDSASLYSTAITYLV